MAWKLKLELDLIDKKQYKTQLDKVEEFTYEHYAVVNKEESAFLKCIM